MTSSARTGTERGNRTAMLQPSPARHGAALCKFAATDMDTRHKTIRSSIATMAPKRAVEYIRSFELPPDEASCLIECDVRGKSCVQVAFDMSLSPDTVKKYRRRAYRKIASEVFG